MQTTDDIDVRIAGSADASQIAAVHVRSWQHAYAAIVPADYLNSLDVEAWTQTWRERLAAGPADDIITWVATSERQVVGFASVGPARDEDHRDREREIYSIYLTPEAWGRGAARELMRTVVSAVGDRTPISLWVLADNDRARHFYRRHGFAPDGIEKLRELGGAQLLEVRYRRG